MIKTSKHTSNIKKKESLIDDNVSKQISPAQKINCVVIASSTGGPKALSQICSLLPAAFPVPILLVQHNTSGSEKSFVQLLDGFSKLKVLLAKDGTYPEKGYLYVAPTDKHLLIGADGFSFDDGKPIFNQKPSADILFKSAARHYGCSLISVVLTGMGIDGAQGTIDVKKAGGITIAQDESSSMIYGMPDAAFKTGCVDIVLSLNEISIRLIELTGGVK